MTAAERKEQLRRKAATLPKAEEPELVRRFLELPQVEAAGTVLVYYGVGRELDTEPIIRALFERGKRVALPVCLKYPTMEARVIRDPDRLSANRFGIPEPDALCPVVSQEEVDVVLAPSLLCDREGYRLGQGGGYFDRWLAEYHGFTVTICPADRLVDRLPREPFDVPVGLVLIGE